MMVYPSARPCFEVPVSPDLCPGPHLGPLSAQSLFARNGCYPQRGGVPRHLEGRYPSFLAHNGSCARPYPSRLLRSSLVSGSLQVAASPCWEMALPDVSSAYPSLDAWTYPPAARAVHVPISSRPASAFPTSQHVGRRLRIPAQSSFVRIRISGSLSFVIFRPPSLLATLTAPTIAAQCPPGGCGFYVRAEHVSLPSHASDMLAVRTGQLTAGDSHPIKYAALSAAPASSAISCG
jgi:hypothetical protein